MKRPISSLAAALVAALVLTSCGSSGDDFNKADVTFAQSMIPHHQQAVEMAELAETRASAPEVKKLAEQISKAQGPEIETMKGWLKDWDQPVPDSSMSGMDDNSGDGDMQGMMSGAEMSALGGASGADFDTMFLTMMVAHHTGAIEMAQAEQAKGENSDAKDLAKEIESAQETEIAEMKELLGN